MFNDAFRNGNLKNAHTILSSPCMGTSKTMLLNTKLN